MKKAKKPEAQVDPKPSRYWKLTSGEFQVTLWAPSEVEARARFTKEFHPNLIAQTCVESL